MVCVVVWYVSRTLQRCVGSRTMAPRGASSRSMTTSGSGHNVLFAVALFVVVGMLLLSVVVFVICCSY